MTEVQKVQWENSLQILCSLYQYKETSWHSLEWLRCNTQQNIFLLGSIKDEYTLILRPDFRRG